MQNKDLIWQRKSAFGILHEITKSMFEFYVHNNIIFKMIQTYSTQKYNVNIENAAGQLERLKTYNKK